MADPKLWSLMQRVETCRHHAERLERMGASWSHPQRELASDIARQWRQAAEQMYALATDREFEAIPPLRQY
jgi:hypothetical protein